MGSEARESSEQEVWVWASAEGRWMDEGGNRVRRTVGAVLKTKSYKAGGSEGPSGAARAGGGSDSSSWSATGKAKDLQFVRNGV